MVFLLDILQARTFQRPFTPSQRNNASEPPHHQCLSPNSVSCLGNCFLCLGQDELDVAGVGHVRVDLLCRVLENATHSVIECNVWICFVLIVFCGKGVHRN